MPDVTKRILTDETGQDIVDALEALTNVVDPNGTTIAAAAKLNNMTTSITVLPAGSTPTSSLTEVNGHFHLTLGVPIELPTVTSTNNGEILKVENGAWTVGAAPTGVPDVTASDNGRVLQVNNGEWTAQDALPTTMVGATSSTAGTAGLVPAPTTADAEKFFRGDGTWQDGGRPMVILSYGNSVWDDFIEAYNNNVIVYCRASSSANPASGNQTRMAFMAYVNNPTTPTEVEFQYYRSMSTHSASQMGDQVFVYKLAKTGGWSVTTREASIKSIAAKSGSKIEVNWNNNAVTLSNTMTAEDMPMSSSDATTVDSVINEQSQAIAKTQNGLAYIVGDTNTTGSVLAIGQFVYVKGHATIAEGLRTVTASIAVNGSITTSNTSSCDDGGLNVLGGRVARHISNANGDAWQFDSGLMICTKDVSQNMACTNAWGSIYESTNAVEFGNWAVAFTQTPIVSGNVANGTLACWIERFYEVSATSAGKGYVVRPTSATNEVRIHIIGIGLWK